MTTNHQPTSASPTTTATPERAETKRAYRRPSLTALGSVRELTLAATGSVGDGGAGLRPGP